MFSKIKNFFREKSLKKKEIEKIKAFIINKNNEIVDTFIDLKKPTKEEIKEKLSKIQAIEINNFGIPFSFSFKFQNFKNLQFNLAINERLTFGCYGIEDLHGFNCDLIKPINLKEYPSRFAAGYFLVSIDDKNQNKKELKNLVGEKILEKLKEAEKNMQKVDKGYKLKAIDWKTREKAELLYKNMLSTSNGYINKYTAAEMFK